MPENNLSLEQQKQVEKMFTLLIKQYNSGGGFVGRKPIDSPTDSFSPVNRRFATLNGVVANRPVSSVAVVGQSYYATDTFIPMTYSIQGWRNGVGSVVAVNN